MGSLVESSYHRILPGNWRPEFSDDADASERERELTRRIRSICENKFQKYDELKIKATISEGNNFEFYNETRSQFYEIENYRDFEYFFNRKKLDLQKNSLSLDIHPLFLINPGELPDQLLQQCFSKEHSNEFYSEMQDWVEKHFNMKITDDKSFQDYLIFFIEIWKHPEMIKRVQNLLIEKMVLKTKDNVSKLKNELTGVTKYIDGTIMTSSEGADKIKKLTNNLSHAEKFWFWGEPASFFSSQTFGITCLSTFFAAHIFNAIKIGLEYLVLISIATFIVASPIFVYLKNRSIKEDDISSLKEIKDIEAIKIVFEASDAVAQKNEWFFSRWIPSFLCINLSLSQRFANMENYAKEHDISYIAEPDSIDTKTSSKTSIANYIPSKRYIAASMAIGIAAALYQTNVLHNAASWISSFWANSSNTFSSGNSAPEKLDSGIVSSVPTLSEAVNSCISKYGPAATLTYEKAKKVFKCFDPLSSFDNTENWKLVKKTYRQLTQFAHPDKGGSNENMLILGAAKDVLLRWL